MSQLALARYYRPRTFQTLVGQDITVRALTNALETKRLHHAYLFTGTRGIGKTTLARVLAKALSCESGISASPCGSCSICRAIDAGSYVDLLEIDAASRTKVEDMRELLDNVQYLPTVGRFKIYLIDEVHMLSGHSFNALLKTLEEPPPHVVFLLATTDPQKLPDTILSRCLQFHLKRMSVNTIAEQLTFILQQENKMFEPEALLELARAGEGSMRDAISLLEQALSYGAGSVTLNTVQALLGLPESEQMIAILRALLESDASQVLSCCRQLADSTPDFTLLLIKLMTLLHQIAVVQQVPEALEDSRERASILALGSQFSPEEVQLYYQIGLQGQRDLPYAPDPELGFEMILLRMLAFQPAKIADPLPLQAQEATAPVLAPAPVVSDTPNWHAIVPRLNLSGLAKVLAEHCSISLWTEDRVQLTLDQAQEPLLNKRYEERIAEALAQFFGKKVHLKIVSGKPEGESLASKNQRVQSENVNWVHNQVHTDPHIQKIMQTFDASIEGIEIIE